MSEHIPWYDKYVTFKRPLIMYGEHYWEYKDNLMKQVELLLQMDSGLAQPCHCEGHDSVECKKREQEYYKERMELAENIKTALNLK